tara:strand:+ start:931 stop:1443 length:513 start_codon:yes stop_codon:yes gene_type:complete
VAYSSLPKTRRDGSLTLRDATAVTPVELTISFEEGAFSMDTPKEAQTVIRDRGVISTVRKGDSEPSASGSFTAFFRQFTDGGEAGSLLDFVNQTGHYASNVSTGSSGSPFVEFYCVDIEYIANAMSLGDDSKHIATLSKCVCTVSFSEGDPSSFTISFTCYGGVTYSTAT